MTTLEPFRDIGMQTALHTAQRSAQLREVQLSSASVNTEEGQRYKQSKGFRGRVRRTRAWGGGGVQGARE